MTIVHVSVTEAEGVPSKLVQSLLSVERPVRLVTWESGRYPTDLVQPSWPELGALISDAALVHIHGLGSYNMVRPLLGDRPFLVQLHGLADRPGPVPLRVPHVVSDPALIAAYPEAPFLPVPIFPWQLPVGACHQEVAPRVFFEPGGSLLDQELSRNLQVVMREKLGGRIDCVVADDTLDHRALIALRATCHICVDRLGGGWSLGGMEALAQGLVVMGSPDDQALDCMEAITGAAPPLVDTSGARDPARLLSGLISEALSDPARFAGRRDAGRSFIMKHYRGKLFAEAWTAFQAETLRASGGQDMDLRRPPRLDEAVYRRQQVEAGRARGDSPEKAGRMALLDSLIELFPEPVEQLLEIGCSTGGETVRLKQVAHEITGIEVGVERVVEARARCIEGFDPMVMDMHDLDFEDESFDAVFANNVLEHAHDHRRAIAEIERVLRPGGLLIAAVPPDALGRHTLDHHLWKATPAEIGDALASFEPELWVEDMHKLNLSSPESDWKMVLVRGRKGFDTQSRISAMPLQEAS